jgi:hypothetical protein
MDTMTKPVQNGRGRRRRWSSEQKRTVLQDRHKGTPWNTSDSRNHRVTSS